jgi:hypothetical protein
MMEAGEKALLLQAVEYAASPRSFRDDEEFFTLFDMTRSSYAKFAQRFLTGQLSINEDWELVSLTVGLCATYPHAEGEGFFASKMNPEELSRLQVKLREARGRSTKDILQLSGFAP